MLAAVLGAVRAAFAAGARGVVVTPVAAAVRPRCPACGSGVTQDAPETLPDGVVRVTSRCANPRCAHHRAVIREMLLTLEAWREAMRDY